jgi:hypothetical protein
MLVRLPLVLESAYVIHSTSQYTRSLLGESLKSVRPALCEHSSSILLPRQGWNVEERIFGHHLPELDANSSITAHSVVPCRLETTPYRKRSTSHETCSDGVPGVFLLPEAFDSTVIHAVPEDRSSSLGHINLCRLVPSLGRKIKVYSSIVRSGGS